MKRRDGKIWFVLASITLASCVLLIGGLWFLKSTLEGMDGIGATGANDPLRLPDGGRTVVIPPPSDAAPLVLPSATGIEQGSQDR